MARLSVIIPSRDERFLIPTIRDVFKNATQEIEVVAVLDSNLWPEGWKEITDQYPNLHTIHNGHSIGMRGSINKGVASAISRGAKYIMKSDGHCSFSEGFDEVLKAECEPNWVVVPRRGRLDPEAWTATETHKPDIDYHYLSFPDNPDDFGGPGLNGKPWDARSRERKDILLDDEMSSQGSCWFMYAEYFNHLLLMDEVSYGSFWNEFQEIGLKCWLSGGQVKINKKAKYLHLHKGKKYGKGYRLEESQLRTGATFTKNWIWNDAWLKQTLPFSWLIEHFWPVPSWPDNWEEILYATRKPRAMISSTNRQELLDAGVMGRGVADTRLEFTGSRLVIYEADYGVPPEQWIDVREQLQSLVKDNSLDIIVNNSTLTPDANPFRGKKKTLKVVYSIDGGEQITRRIEEKDWLIIGPVRDSNVPATVKGGSDGVRLTIQPQLSPDLKIHSSDVVVLHEEFDEAKWQEVKRVTYTGDGKEVSQPIPLSLSGTNDTITVRRLDNPPTTAPALNDYLIRRFSISPQRLRGPMPIELRDFHRNDLAQLFAELGFKRGAEIGVAEGNYSEVLLKANPECELLLVDPWHAYAGNPQNKSNDKHEFAYNEVVRKTKDYPHVDIRQGYSMDVVDGIMLNELDFVYVDACHLFDDCVMDIIEWSKRVRSGGIVSGDDYYALDQKRWVGGGVVEAVQAYVNAHRIPIWYIFQGHKSVDYFWCKP